jgi:glycosyltransferase involved in cell wall biosynthesis
MTTTVLSDKTRILLSGHLPPPMGGIAAFYQSLLNSSLPERVNLKFVCTSSQSRTLAQSGNFTLTNLFSAIADCWRFTVAVITHRPQLTHIATAFGLSFIKHSVCVVVARLSGSQVLLHPHCGFTVLYTDRSPGWQWFFRRIIGLTDGVIALSSEWEALTAVVPDCPVFGLPNAIDLAPFEGVAQARNSADQAQAQIEVLYLGCVGKAKGSFDLVEAAKEISAQKLPIHFDLVGEELEPGGAGQLNRQIERAGLGSTIAVRPPIYGSQKIDLFRKADLFIYPSYAEGMPMAVIEAMACGLPVIATNVGGLPDLVSDGLNGLLVGPGCPDQLAHAVVDLSANPALRRMMQANSYQKARASFDIETLVTRLIAIYTQALSEK